jgi:rhamnose transport system ATP-binding protein
MFNQQTAPRRGARNHFPFSQRAAKRPDHKRRDPMTTPLLQLSNITKSFGEVRALRGVSFDLQPGEVHALLGENGAGKSTLIKTMTGAHQPDAGQMNINGTRYSEITPAQAHALGIAVIYQQPALFPDLTVAENLALVLEKPSLWSRVNWKQRRDRAVQLLQQTGANIRPDQEVRQLSMPEQQLVEIARALGAGARVLIMDEPTASLTAREVDLLLSLIKELRNRGVGIVYITHRLEEVFQIADRVTVLRDGQSVGTREVTASETPLTKEELIHLMVGRELQTIYPPSQSVPGDLVFEARGLGCRFSGIHDVNFEVRSGEILGLAGLVGAGRTEAARIIFGITPADRGTLRLAGRELAIHTPRHAVEAGIGYVPEDRRRHGVILEMPIASNITMGIHPRIFPGGWLRSDAEKNLSERFIQSLAIKTPSSTTRAGNLSGGNQQKVALARWLASEPKVLILDEPTQGVDVGAKSEIHKLIRQLAAQGVAVIMISSDLPEVVGMCDRIAVMRGGTITQILPKNSGPNQVMQAALGGEH